MATHVIKSHRTMYTDRQGRKTKRNEYKQNWRNRNKLVNFINVSILVLIYHNFTECHCWGKLCEVYTGSLCIISCNCRCESTVSSIKFSIKIYFKKLWKNVLLYLHALPLYIGELVIHTCENLVRFLYSMKVYTSHHLVIWFPRYIFSNIYIL